MYSIDSYSRITQTGHQFSNPSGQSGLNSVIWASPKNYFGSFEKFRQTVYGASLGTSAFPLAGSEWIGKATTAFIVGLVTLIAAIVVGSTVFWVVGIRVLRPVNAMTEAMTILADGDLEIEIPA